MNDRTVIKTIKKVMPAVVSIVIAKHLQDLEREMPHGFYPSIPGTPKHRKMQIPDSMVDKHGMVEVGGGSGCIVDQAGLILTNKHVVDDAEAEYTVVMNDGRKFPAHILSCDPINDVAILSIEATGLPYVKLGDATQLELGQSVIAIGNALGIFKNTVSLGIISGLSRSITAPSDANVPVQEMRGLIQTDAAINPGNSGGPLVNEDGRIVGVNAAIVSGAQSIGFAIPISAAKRDIEDIKKYGRIKRPLLGLRYVMIDDDLKAKADLSVDYGALVIRESDHDFAVAAGSPADKAGLKEKDIILTLNGQKLDREHPIQDSLENLNVGDVIHLVVLRDGHEMNTSVTLEERK